MSTETKNYDADQITIAIAGIPVTGYADGEFFTLEMETDSFTDTVGTDGEVTRSKTNDRRATAHLKLMQSSDSNDLLSALYNTDLNAPNGAGVGAFLVRDRQGRALYTAAACWIQKPPPVAFDRTAKERDWTIRIGSLARFDGGN
jgi:hypothetical protein